jgi:hypothetical protein
MGLLYHKQKRNAIFQSIREADTAIIHYSLFIIHFSLRKAAWINE